MEKPEHHRAHHHASHVTPIHSQNILTMLQQFSLPHIQPQDIMFSPDRSPKGSQYRVKRTTSITSVRRSVTGMKNLLPLKLSSTTRSDQEWPSPTSSNRSTFGLLIPPPKSILERRARHSFVPPTMAIRPEQYRDTPIYTEPGSPLMGRAYYTDDDVCFSCSPPGSYCGDPYIVHEYESSSDGGYACGEWLRSVPENFVAGGSGNSTDGTRDSDLSFKCQGESSPFETPLFRDEAAWLSSSSPPRGKFNRTANDEGEVITPITPEYGAEGWLDDASSYDGDDDDILVSLLPHL
jgi:hypothetical protein